MDMETFYEGMRYVGAAVVGTIVGLKLSKIEEKTPEKNDAKIDYLRRPDYLWEMDLAMDRLERLDGLERIIN